MAKKKRKHEEDALYGNLTAMIDVVFQIIIFFVCTANMQDSEVDSRIRLPDAPNGIVEKKKDPRQVVISVDKSGVLRIGRSPLPLNTLDLIMRKAVKQCGSDTPVVIRGDERCTHKMIKTVMDTCTGAGIYKIKFSAMKEKGKSSS
jgi:biopolymer transport protein ExbD